MEDNFRKRLKLRMDKYRAKNLMVKEVYENAPLRQLKLISMCFDACIASAIKHSDEAGIDTSNLYVDGHPIHAEQFYPANTDLGNLSKWQMRKIRKNMTDFLEEHCGLLIMLDGHVKSQDRAKEKAADSPDGSISNVNDINRLTIVSENPDILNDTIKYLKKITPSNDFCGKEDWEMKGFGMLSKSQYIFIDGFPAEIHLNEPKQLIISKAMTHAIYEVMRMDISDKSGMEAFETAYALLPETIRERMEKYKQTISQSDFEILQELNAELSKSIDSSKPFKQKYDDLLNTHRKVHEVFFDNSTPEWQKVFIRAKTNYVQKKKKTQQNEKRFPEKQKGQNVRKR